MKAVIQNGKVINIGEWDFRYDENGNPKNPMPEEAEFGDFDIVQNAVGQYVLPSDYRKLREAEYPSIGDQLDALFKAGVFPAEMSALIASVKDKYPKPESDTAH